MNKENEILADLYNQLFSKPALETEPESLSSARTPVVGVPNGEPEIGVLASTVAPEAVDWIWPGYIARGKITLLDGDPGVGKSTLLSDFAARITTGRPMPFLPNGVSFRPIDGGVVLVTGEDGIADTIVPRFIKAGGDTVRYRIVSSIPDGTPSGKHPIIPDDLATLERALDSVAARLLIIDPLAAHLSIKIDSYKDQSIRSALAPLSEFAQRKGIGVILVRHLNKGDGKALYRGGGSIGIIGAARQAFLLGKDPGDPSRIVLAPVKSNNSKLPPSLVFRLEGDDWAHVVWEGESRLTAEDLVDGVKLSKVDEAENYLRAKLADGPLPSKEVNMAATEAGISKRTLDRARDRVAISRRVGGIAEKGEWELRLRDSDDDSEDGSEE